MAVFAHPDDETFRSGGTLALIASRGVHIHLITATLGELGSLGSPPLCTREELSSVRERELACACSVLGIEEPWLLGYRDGTLAQVHGEKLTEDVMRVVREVQPQVMLTFGQDGLSGHPDHIAIGQAARDAYLRAAQVAALYTMAVPESVAKQLKLSQVRAVPDAEISLHVDVSSVWETKLAAMGCHPTQLSATPLMQAPEEKQKLFFGREYFVRAAERKPSANFMEEILADITC